MEPGARWLEIGTGTGAGAGELRHRGAQVVATDISAEMLSRNQVPGVAKMRSDAAALPVPHRSFDAVLLVNMLLFPVEIDRVLVSCAQDLAHHRESDRDEDREAQEGLLGEEPFESLGRLVGKTVRSDRDHLAEDDAANTATRLLSK